MGKDVQERFEDYLELDQYIEQLHSERTARLPANLAPQQRHIYSMALFFHAASPHTAEPRPEFREQLRQHLLEQIRDDEQGTGGVGGNAAPTAPPPSQKQFRGIYSQKPLSPPTPLPSPHPESTDVGQPKKRGTGRRPTPFSRRALFTGGTV